MQIGYLRVSTRDQTLDLQQDAMERAGVTKLFSDEGVSGTIDPMQRPGFAQLLDHAREGDEIVAWRLDRVGRNAAAVLRLVEHLDERGITLRTISDGISTAGTTGRLVLGILAAVAQMEREVTVERVHAGIAAARERGTPLGRPPALNVEQRALAHDLRERGRSYAAIARTLGVGKSTVARVLTAGSEVDAVLPEVAP